MSQEIELRARKLKNLLVLIRGCRGVSSLLVEVKVPRYRTCDSEARLSCHYSLEGLTLYSLKWYKGDSQFYQYIPGNRQPKTYFKVPGVNVDASQSTEGEVLLVGLQVASSGSYRCEVITEAPKFVTKFGEGNMTVIDPPASPPSLRGANSAYRLGDLINVTCSSEPSSPPVTLHWAINDRPVMNPHMLQQLTPWPAADHERHRSELALFFRAAAQHFIRGTMRLKCSASIGSVYSRSHETTVIEASFLERSQAEESRGYPFFFFSGATTTWSHSYQLALASTVLLSLLKNWLSDATSSTKEALSVQRKSSEMLHGARTACGGSLHAVSDGQTKTTGTRRRWHSRGCPSTSGEAESTLDPKSGCELISCV
ncbi:Immunoglobulin V-set domain [Trinorchestia longiramus]|nr:Immunoglobulin V-set domain [Trinorchestia longiramus]